jgi:hypothetical protein
MMMEAVRTFETAVCFNKTKQRYNPEGCHLVSVYSEIHNHKTRSSGKNQSAYFPYDRTTRVHLLSYLEMTIHYH